MTLAPYLVEPSADRVRADMTAVSLISDPSRAGWARSATSELDVESRHCAAALLLSDVAGGLGYRRSRLYSGAEHDAAMLADRCLAD